MPCPRAPPHRGSIRRPPGSDPQPPRARASVSTRNGTLPGGSRQSPAASSFPMLPSSSSGRTGPARGHYDRRGLAIAPARRLMVRIVSPAKTPAAAAMAKTTQRGYSPATRPATASPATLIATTTTANDESTTPGGGRLNFRRRNRLLLPPFGQTAAREGRVAVTQIVRDLTPEP